MAPEIDSALWDTILDSSNDERTKCTALMKLSQQCTLKPDEEYDETKLDSQFAEALKLVKSGRLRDGLEPLRNSTNRSQLALCLEQAAHVLISRAVEKIRMHFTLKEADHETPVDVDRWVEATCPVRIDLAGGWTDTPPICYEFGGSVTGVAIKMDNQRPIFCRVRRRTKPGIHLSLSGLDGTATLDISTIDELMDYANPLAKGILLKASIVTACSINDVAEEPNTLEEYLKLHFGCAGLEMESSSLLPEGSGMGTSSILAATVLAALWTVSGRKFADSDIIHGVLIVEQCMTTGGGWQDQVNGALPGFKIGTSNCNPNGGFKVSWESIPVSDSFKATLEDRLILIYTGKVRLAKNLLQTVIKQWYVGDVGQIMKRNFELSQRCREALEQADADGLGRVMNEYWDCKCLLAEGALPEALRPLFTALKPSCLGMSLAGAGGGGYLVALLKDGISVQGIQDMLREKGFNQKCQRVQIDLEGLKVEIAK